MKRCSQLFFAAALVLLVPRPASAQDVDLRDDPGYLDLDNVDGWFDEEPWLEVNINGTLLNLVTEASRNEDPEFTGILQDLRAIEVRGYPLPPGRFDEIGSLTAELADRLEGDGWETVVRVRDEEQRVNVFMKAADNVISGLVVMILQPDEEEGAIFVNIVGDIDPADIGRIGQKFDIDPLSDIP